MANASQLPSASQIIQKPVADGGLKTRIQKFRDYLIHYYGGEG